MADESKLAAHLTTVLVCNHKHFDGDVLAPELGLVHLRICVLTVKLSPRDLPVPAASVTILHFARVRLLHSTPRNGATFHRLGADLAKAAAPQ